MFRQAYAVREHPFLATRDFETMADNLRATQSYVDEMAEEADWIMLPLWHLRKRCTSHNLADGRRGPAKDKTIQVSKGNMAKFWQDSKKHPLYARSKG
jgi:hypothetical protein